MKPEEFVKEIGKLRIYNQRKINDIHIWSSMAIGALKHSLSDDAILNKSEFDVPSTKPGKKVPRNAKKVREIITEAIDQDLYTSVLVYIVAQVEAFLNDVIYLVLSFDNRRIKQSVTGLDTIKSIDVAEVVDSKSKGDIIEKIIEKRLISLFYAKPAVQFDYIQQVIGVDIQDDKKNAWIELKATRDIIVHNSGIINGVYIQKCGGLSRGRIGEHIEINEAYYEQALTLSKSLIGRVCTQLQSVHKSQEN